MTNTTIEQNSQNTQNLPNPPNPENYAQVVDYLTDCRAAYEIHQRRNRSEPGVALRMLRKLDPSDLWGSLLEKTYRVGKWAWRSWTLFGFLRNLYQTYRIWFPNGYSINDALSGAAVLTIFLSNPTPMNIGMYLIYLSNTLKLDIANGISTLINIMGKAISLGISSLQQLIEKMISWITLAQKEPNACEPTANEDSMQEDFLSALLTMIGAAAASVKGACLDSIAVILGKGTKSLNNLSKTVKSTEYLYAKLQAFVDLVVGCIRPDREVMALATVLADHDLKISGVPCGVSKFLETIIERSTPEAANKMILDITYLRETQQILNDSKLMVATMSEATRKTFLPMLKLIERVTLQAENQTIIPVRKFEPHHVCFVGVPNTGKSVVTGLMVDFMLEFLKTRPQYGLPCDEKHQSMAWTEDQNFSSGYFGQYIVAMDDICKESKPGEKTSGSFLINAVGPVGMNVPGAAVEDKKNPFRTKQILSTSNDYYPSAQSLGLKTALAFWSRRHLLIEMVMTNTFDPDLHRSAGFRFLNPIEPKSAPGPVVTFREMAMRVLRSFIVHYEHEMSLMDLKEWAGRLCTKFETDIAQVELQCEADRVRRQTAEYSRGQDPEGMRRANQPMEESEETEPTCRPKEDHRFEPYDAPDFVDGVDQDDFEVQHHFNIDDNLPIFADEVYPEYPAHAYYVVDGGQMLIHEGMVANPGALAAVSLLMAESSVIVQRGNEQIEHHRIVMDGNARWYQEVHGFDFERAIDYMNRNRINWVRPDELVDEAMIERNEQWQGPPTILVWAGLERSLSYCVSDEIFVEELLLNAYEMMAEGSNQSFANAWSSSEEEEPTGLLVDDGTRIRIRIQWWLKDTERWRVILGVGIVIAALATGGLYMLYSKEPTYAGTNLAHKFDVKHEEFSDFAYKKSKNVHLVHFGKYICTGFFYNGRSLLTVMHSPGLAKNGDEICVSFANGKVYKEPFNDKNLVKLSLGSDLAVYHMQNLEIPMAPDSRSQFAQYVPKETCEVEVVMSFLMAKKVARAIGLFHYSDASGRRIQHNGGLKVQGQLGKGHSGSIMIIPGMNRIIGVQVSQNAAETQFEHITRDHLPDAPGQENATPFECTSLKFVQKADKMMSANQKTSFKPSMLSQFMTVLFATTYAPSVLSANDKRMKEPCDDVLLKSMKGYDHPFATLDKRILTQVVEEMSTEDNWLRDGERRLLTMDEILNGSPTLNVKPLDITTAPGLPWCHSAKLKGKRDFILGNTPDRIMVPELKEAVENYNFDAKVLGYACLKDELRPQAKIEKGATRSFIVMPMDYNLKVREYFGAYVGVQHKLAGTISSCVGINPYEHWDSLYQRLAEYDDLWEDFDYADWDRTLSGDWFEAYADRTSNWYNDGELNRMRRRKLMRQLSHSLVQIKDSIYEIDGGNRSGMAITAEVNTDVHEMKMLYTWIILAKIHAREKANLESFRQHNRLVLYGDDLVKATRGADWFNGNNIKPISNSVGMNITPADKVSETFEKKDPRTITFLKRAFGERVAAGKRMCPLAMPSITKMVHYTRRNEDEHGVTKMNVDCAVKEMFFHGKEKYELFLGEVKNACREAKLESTPVWKDWETLREEWLEEQMDPPTYW